jgi:hypothetical protein
MHDGSLSHIIVIVADDLETGDGGFGGIVILLFATDSKDNKQQEYGVEYGFFHLFSFNSANIAIFL